MSHSVKMNLFHKILLNELFSGLLAFCLNFQVKLVRETGLARGAVLNTHPSVVDTTDGLRKFGLFMLNEYAPDQIKYRIKNYYKFMFTRHPMERILSAYRSKFEKRSDNKVEWEYFYKVFNNDIIHISRKDKSDRTSMISFEEFVKYIIYKSRRNEKMEHHWERYYELCHMCHIDYDFVGKFDTLVQDISFVLRKIFPHQNDYFFPNVSQPRSTVKLLEKYYSQLDSSLIGKLHKAYNRDMKLFGYEFEINRP